MIAMEPDRPLSDFHRQFIDPLDVADVRILEVGSGPITMLGIRHPSKRLDIVATDVLAEAYSRMLEKKGLVPPIPTIWADAERLSEKFHRNSFDYVVANNCIDHCENPSLAITEMLAVVKPGCSISLRHRQDEGRKQGYLGLHKWNFGLEGDDPVIFNKRESVNIRTLVGGLGEVTVFGEPDHVVFAVRRTG